MPMSMPSPIGSSPELLDYSDYNQVRKDLRGRVLDAVTTASTVENDRYLMRATNVAYQKPDFRYSLAEQKKAILEGRSLSDRITGNWEVLDKGTNKVVGRSGKKGMVNVPYLTDRGTYVRNGTEYTISKQLRLVPGAYTRKTDDGNIETQFNAKPRTGPSFRVYMEPTSSYFYMRYNKRKIPLYPIMRAMGKSHEDIAAVWGKEIAEKNRSTEKSPYAVNFLKQYVPEPEEQEPGLREEMMKAAGLDKEAHAAEYQLMSEDYKARVPLLYHMLGANVPVQGRFLDKTAAEPAQYGEDVRENLLEDFGKIGLDERTTKLTLGKSHANVTPDAIMSATTKILRVAQGAADADSRDSLQFQDIYDVSDFLSEKIKNDQNGVLKQILWKVTQRNGDISRIPAAPMDKHVQHLFVNSGLSQALEEINPMDMYDQNQRIVRMGEGAMTSVDVVPKEARNVQPSYLNYIDPVRAPESMKIGVDMKLARDVRRGPDRQMYTRFLNPRSGKPQWVGVRDATQKIVAWPDAMKSKDPFVVAMVPEKGMQWVRKEKVDLVVPNNDDTFSDGANLVPLKSGVKGMRLLMGAKFAPQAVPLVSREAPLVQTLDSDGKTAMEERIGRFMGAIRSPQGGTVKAVRKDRIDMTYDDGTEDSLDIYDNFPYARKTFIRNTPQVKAGQRVEKGGLIATSNYTDKKGIAALGTNLRVAYLNYDGKVFEDAVVVSESAAKKLTSEHMYSSKLEKEKEIEVDRERYRSLFPAKFNREQLKTIGPDGIVKPGTQVSYGDPLILAVREQEPSPSSMGRRLRSDESITWKKRYPGVVTDAAAGKKAFQVSVRANTPLDQGDKLSNRFGGKGVVSEVVRDEDMPRDAQGRPLDLIMSPLGVISRTNPGQKIEVQLGKVSAKTGKPYVLPGFMDEDMEQFASAELRKHNLTDTEQLIDPRTGKKIPEIFTGTSYFYKMQHTSEGKGKSRSQAGYTAEDQPAKGGKTGAKHLGGMEIQSLLAHGADEVLKDLKVIKGQKNDAFWRQLKLGQTPTMPGTPLVYEKFKDMIRAAGVQLREENDADHIFAMTNEDAKKLTGNREITSAATYSAKSMKPIKGGLFDPDATGSEANGDRWGFIKLPEPMPNPVMIDPLRSILGLKQQEFADLVAGRKSVGGQSGTQALQTMLSRLNVPAAKKKTLDEIKFGVKSKRDAAVKKFRYLDALEKNKVNPSDFLMDRVPVLPPRFRPITKQNEMTMVADPNYMYKALLESIEDYKETKDLPDDIRSDAKEDIFNSYKSLIGLTDPQQQQLQQKNVSGILSSIFGKGSPKKGFVQRRVMGTNIDVSGMGVVAPNPSLKLNQVGMPEKLAWNLYEPFIIRDLVRKGMPAAQAAKAVEQHAPPAYAALQSVIKDRPVLVNRAPSLHKYSMMSFWPVLTKGSTVQVSPTIVKPFGMDFDGDTASFTVPVSKDAVNQAVEKMMPEKNLISARSGRPTYVPSNEYLQGMYLATRKPKRGPAKVFKTQAEAVSAYRRGEIKIDDPIKIVEA